MSISLVQGGSFVSTGAGQYIPVPGGINYFRVLNLTQAAAQTNGVGFNFEWFADRTPIGGAELTSFISYATTPAVLANLTSVETSGGFVYNPGPGSVSYPIQTGTAITAAGPAVATATNTLSNGDRVRLTGVNNMTQITGIVATVSSVSGSNFTLAGLNTTGFTASTAFKFQKIGPFEPVLPEYAIITNISNATNGVITLSAITNYQPGMKIRLANTTNYNMPSIEGAEATILSVGTFTTYGTYTLTTDLNTSSAGTWTWPASGLAPTVARFATVAPDGQHAYYDPVANIQYGYNVTQAPFQSAYPTPTMYLYPGASGPAGQNGDVIEWMAFRYE